jgi:hypothetical protein
MKLRSLHRPSRDDVEASTADRRSFLQTEAAFVLRGVKRGPSRSCYGQPTTDFRTRGCRRDQVKSLMAEARTGRGRRQRRPDRDPAARSIRAQVMLRASLRPNPRPYAESRSWSITRFCCAQSGRAIPTRWPGWAISSGAPDRLGQSSFHGRTARGTTWTKRRPRSTKGSIRCSYHRWDRAAYRRLRHCWLTVFCW